MPWMFPSHPAAVLPMKLWRPQAFSGLALALGSMAPDLDFILRVDHDWVVSHTLAAQGYFTVPVVLLLHHLATAWVLPWLLPRLPTGPPLHLEAMARMRPATSARDWLVVGVSGWLGGLSHLVLDGVTHGNHSGWAVRFLPFLRTPVPGPAGPVPLHDALHTGLTVVLGVATLLLWRGYAAAEPAPLIVSASPDDRRSAARRLALCAGVGVVFGLLIRPWSNLGQAVELGAYGGLTFLFAGIVLAAGADGARRLLRSSTTASGRTAVSGT